MALILLFFLFVVLLVISLIAGANRRVLFEAISGWVIVLTLIGTIVGIVKLKGYGENDVPIGATLLVISLAALAATIFFLALHSIRKGRGQDGR